MRRSFATSGYTPGSTTAPAAVFGVGCPIGRIAKIRDAAKGRNHRPRRMYQDQE